MSVKETVAYLLDLRARNVTVESLPLELAPKSLAAAYAAQDQLVDKLCGLWGGERAGYKIALTSAMAQSLTAIDHPVFGRIISSRVYASGTALPANLFTTRVVESEFAFTIGHDVPKRAAAYTANSIAPFVDAVHPAIELVDCHFAGLDRVTGVSLAADNAIHGAFVCGEACDADDLMQLNNARVELEVNGEVLLTGAGDRTLGHPLKALAWLANALPSYGLSLSAGDQVTTGLTTDGIYDAKPGDTLVARFEFVGEVQLSFT